MSLEAQPHETSNLCTTRSCPLAMLAMHTPPAPPVPEFHPKKASYHAGRPCGNEIFPLPPKIKIPNSHIVRYTCQFEQYLPHTQNECHAHPNWAPTKEPTVSCWRYTPTPKQDRFQDLLEAICPEFLHTNLTK